MQKHDAVLCMSELKIGGVSIVNICELNITGRLPSHKRVIHDLKPNFA